MNKILATFLRGGNVTIFKRTLVSILSLLCLLLILSFLVMEHSHGKRVLSWQHRPIDRIVHEIGNAYQAPLDMVWMSSHAGASPAKVLENGSALGPGNSVHDAIRQLGGGRYSFWHDALYFSTSDNSNPGTNGRKYEVLWPTPISKYVSGGVYASTFLVMLMACFLLIQCVRNGYLKISKDANHYLGRANKRLSAFLRLEDINVFKKLFVSVVSLFCVLLMLSFLVMEHSRGTIVLSWQHRPIDRIVHEIGNAYQAPLDMVWMSSHAGASPAKVLENSSALGPGNSVHDAIRQLGGGRYSFWHDTLYFSTSDNSNPGTNGRKYEVLWPMPISKYVSGGVYASTFLVMLMACFLLIQGVRNGYLKISNDCNYLGYIAPVLVSSIGFFAYIILYKPEAALEDMEECLLLAVRYLISIASGFYAYRIIRCEARMSWRILPQLCAFLLLTCFLILKSDMYYGFEDLRKQIPFSVLMVLIGIIYAHIYFKHQLHHSLLPFYSFWERRGLILILLFSIVIAIPGLIKPVIANWDCVGIYDARGYDVGAHRIATMTPEITFDDMPLYYYGLALTYYIFGHFFYIQQIISVCLALAAIVLFSLTAWKLFQNKWAVFLAGVVISTSSQLYAYIPIATQVENWYIPIMILVYFAVFSYWRKPVISRLVFIAISIGIAFNLRAQGAFIFAFLCLTPFFLFSLSFKERFLHSFLAICIVALSLLPWSVRNYINEHRFSPMSYEAATAGIYNDHRVLFYGLNQPSYDKVLSEYVNKYPNDGERSRAIQQDVLKNTFGDPIWLVKAMYWRTLGIYGLLPPGCIEGVTNIDGPKPTDWSKQFESYVLNVFSSLFLIGITFLGLVSRPRRAAFFLFLIILSSLAVFIFAAMPSQRHSLPVWPIHILLGLFVLFEPVSVYDKTVRPIHRGTIIFWTISLFCAAAVLLLCYLTVGRENLYRPLREKAIVFDKSITLGQDVPSLNDYNNGTRNISASRTVFRVGGKVKVRCIVQNYMLPHERIAVPVPEMVIDPSKETFYFSATYPKSSTEIRIAYFGATANTLIRENDVIDVEGRILSISTWGRNVCFWIRADKIILVDLKVKPKYNKHGFPIFN